MLSNRIPSAYLTCVLRPWKGLARAGMRRYRGPRPATGPGGGDFPVSPTHSLLYRLSVSGIGDQAAGFGE